MYYSDASGNSSTSLEWSNRPSHDMTSLENMPLNKLPHLILQKMSEDIKPNWEKWESYASQLTNNDVSTVKRFIDCISDDKSTIKLKQLIEIGNKIGDLVIDRCLINCKNLIQERQRADSDHSKGFMNDISKETILELALLISESPIDWRLLANGLGFDHLMCRQLMSPKDMLERWISQHPNATVCRLHFEATQLKMKDICQFLDAIPLEGTSNVELPRSLDHLVTSYELRRLETLMKERGYTLNWKDELRWAVSEDNLKGIEMIWKPLNVKIDNLLNSLLHYKGEKWKPTIEKFREELGKGIPENKSSGGITLSQIEYLSKCTLQVRVSPGTRFPFVPVDMDMIKKAMFPTLPSYTLVTFSEFLLLYWQDPLLGENLDLRTFCLKIIDILQHTTDKLGQKVCQSEDVIKAFKGAYDHIKPWRSYNRILAESNNKKEQSEKIANEANAVAKSVIEKMQEDNTCGICMDKERNAVIIPCGHLGYCLECIQKLSNCPACRALIQQRIKVYKI